MRRLLVAALAVTLLAAGMLAWRAGVEVTLQRFDGAIHGFLGSRDDGAASEALAAEKLREAFAAR